MFVNINAACDITVLDQSALVYVQLQFKIEFQPNHYQLTRVQVGAT